MTEADWQLLLESQGGVCAICKQEPKKGRLCIEHEHVKGWKHMPDSERKLYVRGLCCFMCNTQYLGRCITVAKSEAVTAYLKAYELRRPKT